MSLLFNPGPTNVSPRVWQALNTGNLCHREPEFSECLNEVRHRLIQVVNGLQTHEAVALGCSATGCNEAIFSSLGGSVLVIRNGKYSQRLQDIASRCGLVVSTVELPSDRPATSEEADQALRDVEHRLADVDHLAFVHHETTTGGVLPLARLTDLASRQGKTTIVDAVSAMGSLEIDLTRHAIDYCSVNANKGLQALPGLSFVVARRTLLESPPQPSRSVYLDLQAEWNKQRGGGTRFTPPVQLFFAAREALDELLEETVEGRIARYESNAALLRRGLVASGFVLEGEQQSPIVTTVRLADMAKYQPLHDRLKEIGYTIYSDKDTLARGYFRIATMGQLASEDIEEFLRALTRIARSVGVID